MHHTIRSIAVLAIICGQSAILGCPGPEARQQTHATRPGRPPAAGAVRPGPASGDQRMTVSTGFTVDYPKKDWHDARRRGLLVRGPVSQITRSGCRNRADESAGASGDQRNQRSDRHARDRRMAAAPPARDGVFTSVRGFPRHPIHPHRFHPTGLAGPRARAALHAAARHRLVSRDLHDHPALVRQIQRDVSTHRAQRDADGPRSSGT